MSLSAKAAYRFYCIGVCRFDASKNVRSGSAMSKYPADCSPPPVEVPARQQRSVSAHMKKALLRELRPFIEYLRGAARPES